MSELFVTMKEVAKNLKERGITAADIRKEADEKEREGFSMSADFDRILAGVLETEDEIQKG